MANLEKVTDNLATFRRIFKFLGIKDVIEVTNSTRAGMEEVMKKIKKKCVDADLSEGRTKLLIYVYIATHGIMYNGATKTQIVFNEVDASRRYYSVQFLLDYLASENKNVYFIAVLDTCRNRVDKPKTMGKEDSVPEEQIVIPSGKGQILYIFSCTAGGRTLDSTPLSRCIEQVTIEQVNKNNGVFSSLHIDSKLLRYHLNETESTDLT